MSVNPALVRSFRSFWLMCRPPGALFMALWPFVAFWPFIALWPLVAGVCSADGLFMDAAPLVGPLSASLVAVAPVVGPLPASPGAANAGAASPLLNSNAQAIFVNALSWNSP